MKARIEDIYSDVMSARTRIKETGEHFAEVFPDNRDPIRFFSSPARAEIGGNHTDHQHGKVLAAAIDPDTLCAAALNGKGVIRAFSEGYGMAEIDLACLQPVKEDESKSRSFIRGVADRLKRRDWCVEGFDCYVTSLVKAGSSISSSAAFAVLFGEVINGLFNSDMISFDEIAKAAKYAENVHFGKPSGLLDQMTCAAGGFVFIDFADETAPIVERVGFDPKEYGYKLCILATGGSHEGLTDEYASIPLEMKRVAHMFGKEFLREVERDEFFESIPSIRSRVPDRAIMRAMHFFDEDRRAQMEKDALLAGDIQGFLDLVNESGYSSEALLENIFPSAMSDRSLAFGIGWAKHLLDGRGAARVQGGGFAGTLEAFVPVDMLDTFTESYEKVFGKGSVMTTGIRPVGCTEIEI